MSPTLRNILIVVLIVAAGALVYIFFFNGANTEEGSITSSLGTSTNINTSPVSTASSTIDSDYLNLLLNIQSIKLTNTTIFINDAFMSLRDSSISLPVEINPGRKNPFAPIGSDTFSMPVSQDVMSQSDSGSNTNTGNTQNPRTR